MQQAPDSPAGEPVYLERRDPALNMARFYVVSVAPSLFGDWMLVRRWGRIGTSGQLKEEWFPSVAEARAAQARMASAKIRGGYSDG